MRQVLIAKGKTVIVDVPAPVIKKGHVLVEVAYSLISTGTEIGFISDSSKTIIRRGMEEPARVRQVIKILKSEGLQNTVSKIIYKMNESHPIGYSCSGTVIEVGDEVDGISPGTRVACAGIANHAEIVLIPKNLLVKIPNGCNLISAASVTLGAISLQGIRRADPRLGEFVSVIGLGLIGQITVQLLKAAGVRVVGFDLENSRVEKAKRHGADWAFQSPEVDVNHEIAKITQGHGVEATIITASSQSNAIVQQAMEITRKKGRVVVVGAVGLGLNRSPFYEKEIDFLISTAYGLGRYDDRYEIMGLDYPYPYIRWTEKRNMEEYLRLIAQGDIDLTTIIDEEVDINFATEAYDSLISDPGKPLAVLLRYPIGSNEQTSEKKITKIDIKSPRIKTGAIRLALLGAGNFSRQTHLPNLKRLSKLYQTRAIVDRQGNEARELGDKFGAEYVSTSFDDVLSDQDIDLVMICTRHDQHSLLALQALEAGKHVFVEKPLALTREEVLKIEKFYQGNDGISEVPILMTGFNRRFSLLISQIYNIIQDDSNSMIINYRMNAGYLPPDHWVFSEEGGGRNRGEACHIYDLFTYLTDSVVARIETQTIKPNSNYFSQSDNFVVNLGFENGSLGNILYTSLGTTEYPKEEMDIYYNGKLIHLSDYKKLEIFGKNSGSFKSRSPQKGRIEGLQALAIAIKGGTEWPIPLWQ